MPQRDKGLHFRESWKTFSSKLEDVFSSDSKSLQQASPPKRNPLISQHFFESPSVSFAGTEIAHPLIDSWYAAQVIPANSAGNGNSNRHRERNPCLSSDSY
jgi:hypothetical protein